MVPLSCVTLAVTYRTCGELTLPGFCGSLWRGVLGLALRRTVCFARTSVCAACTFHPNCLYPRLFEDVQDGRGYHLTPPRPFVFHLDWRNGGTSCPPGELLGFSISLFGETARRGLPYLVAAFDRIGHGGVGKRRVRLELLGISTVNPVTNEVHQIYRDGNLSCDLRPYCWQWEEARWGDTPADVFIQLHTPLLLKHRGVRRSNGLPLVELVRAVLRRRHYLLEQFTPSSDDLQKSLRDEAESLLALAGQVAVQQDSTYWQPHGRYSGREKKWQSQSGLLGEAVYRQVPTELFPLLQFGVISHAGRGSSMGLGSYAMVINGKGLAPPVWQPSADYDVDKLSLSE